MRRKARVFVSALLFCSTSACGGKALDAPTSEGENRDRGESPRESFPEPVGDPVVVATGGRGEDLPATGGQPADATGGLPSFGGAGTVTESPVDSLHFEATGIELQVGYYDDVTSYILGFHPTLHSISAVVDGETINTTIGGAVAIIIDQCEEVSPGVEECRLDIDTIAGGPSSNAETRGQIPFDNRLDNFHLVEPFIGTVLRSGNDWSLEIDGSMRFQVGVWSGDVLEEVYEDGEVLIFDIVREEVERGELPVTKFSLTCEAELCDLSFTAEAN